MLCLPYAGFFIYHSAVLEGLAKKIMEAVVPLLILFKMLSMMPLEKLEKCLATEDDFIALLRN